MFGYHQAIYHQNLRPSLGPNHIFNLNKRVNKYRLLVSVIVILEQQNSYFQKFMVCLCSAYFKKTFQVMLILNVNVYFSLKVDNINNIDISIYILIYKTNYESEIQKVQKQILTQMHKAISESRQNIPFELCFNKQPVTSCKLRVILQVINYLWLTIVYFP